MINFVDLRPICNIFNIYAMKLYLSLLLWPYTNSVLIGSFVFFTLLFFALHSNEMLVMDAELRSLLRTKMGFNFLYLT